MEAQIYFITSSLYFLDNSQMSRFTNTDLCHAYGRRSSISHFKFAYYKSLRMTRQFRFPPDSTAVFCDVCFKRWRFISLTRIQNSEIKAGASSLHITVTREIRLATTMGGRGCGKLRLLFAGAVASHVSCAHV